MLTITIPDEEYFDHNSKKFVLKKGAVLQLEHSLASISKWESIWEKPFLGKDPKTNDETLSYLECMCLNDVSPVTFKRLTPEHHQRISEYINRKMTATWFNERTNQPPNREVITAEIIYYWMVALTIPFECENWHFNKLLALIKVCNLKNNPSKKKMTRSELLAQQRQLNAQRRAASGSNG